MECHLNGMELLIQFLWNLNFPSGIGIEGREEAASSTGSTEGLSF